MKPQLFKTIQLLVVTVFLVGAFNISSFSQSKSWEGTIVIPTYGFKTDLNPKFWSMDAGRRSGPKIYPYTMQDDLGRELKEVTYKALFVENEYLKVTMLPELGGRIYSVLDKTTNKDMFYMNPVIKPSNIAMRGAFIAGGVEWNAGPQNHTITTMSPVDGVVGQEPDGTAYIEVSNLEQSLRTTWVVRISLHPGKAFLDENIHMYNPTDAINPYYFWNNTAFPQVAGTRFIYPMKLGTDHGGEKFFNWPVNNGVDLSWTKNYVEASSIFAVNAAFDFFGAYDVDSDRGMVQVANHHEHPGKKAWTWGTGDYGTVSQKSLADDGSKYIEVQSGPLMSQSDFGYFIPGASISWREVWYPIHGLGDGFEFATEKVAVNTKRDQKGLGIKIISTEKYPDAVVKVLSGEKALKNFNINLTPESSSSLLLGEFPETVTIVVETSTGTELARFDTPLPIPDVDPQKLPFYNRKSNDSLTVEEIYIKAQKTDRNLERAQARKLYELVLSKDPHHVGALRDLGILDFEAANYESATEKFQKALSQMPDDDGLAWYFLGLCNLKKNDPEAAIHCGFKAARCLGTVALGYDLSGRGYMLKKEVAEALSQFERALASDKNDARLYSHYLLALYANGETSEANKLARERSLKFPSELTPKFLSAIIDKNIDARAPAITAYLGEKDFEVMESSLFFAELGLYKEAIQVLEAACIKTVPAEKQNTMALYYLSWLNVKAGNENQAKNYLEKASKDYQDFVFASRPEEEEFLKYALSVNPKDAIANYQLGNLYANFGHIDEAADYWTKAVTADAALSIPWRNLAFYYWTQKKDYAQAETCFTNAIKARPTDQTLYRDFAKELVDNGKRAEAITLVQKMPVNGRRRSDVVIDLTQNLLDAGRFDESIAVLKNTPYFVNAEGSSITWDIFNKANVGKGIASFNKKQYKAALASFEMALTFPEYLNVGKSESNPTAKAWYWKGKTLQSMGKAKDAMKAWKTGSQLPKGRGEQNEYISLCNTALSQASN